MAYDTYEEFSDTLSDILSSGPPFEMIKWHSTAIAKLIEGMDRDSVVEFANIFYSSEDPSELREGELSTVADLISNLDPNAKKVVAEFKVIFS